MRSLAAALVAVLALSVLAIPASADPGDIDPGWGFLGRVGVDDISGTPLPQPDGRTLVPVTCGTDCGTLARLDGTGRREQTFATGGTVPFFIFGLADLGGPVLALGAGKVARFTADGQLDRTFGTAGVVTLSGLRIPAQGVPSDPPIAKSAAVAPDGSIYLGVQATFLRGCLESDAAVIRLKANGDVDTTFGTGGNVQVDASTLDAATSLHPLADGVIVGVVTRRPNFGSHCSYNDTQDGGLVVRYRADGTPLTSFGFNGVLGFDTSHNTSPAVWGVGVDYDAGIDHLVVAHGHQVRIARLDGTVLSTHDPGPTYADSVVVDSLANIVVGGTRTARLQFTGDTDLAWGSCGITNVGGPIAVYPQGSISARYVLVRQQNIILRLDARGYAQSAPNRTGGGSWLVAADGSVHTTGDALWCGPSGRLASRSPVVGIAAAPSGNGYWVVSADGDVTGFGHTGRFPVLGDLAGRRLNQPIVGMAATPTGNGYWLVARDGGIFSFGDARFYGSTGNIRLNKPIVGMTASPTGNGYWFVASDGGIFAYGDARFFGSTGARQPATPIVGMAATASGRGYFLVAAGGGVYRFGDATAVPGTAPPIGRLVGIGLAGSGYRVFSADGRSGSNDGAVQFANTGGHTMVAGAPS